MSKPSEIEFRVARELWHLDQASSAICDKDAFRQLGLARRYADYSEPAYEIETVDQALEPAWLKPIPIRG